MKIGETEVNQQLIRFVSRESFQSKSESKNRASALSLRDPPPAGQSGREAGRQGEEVGLAPPLQEFQAFPEKPARSGIGKAVESRGGGDGQGDTVNNQGRPAGKDRGQGKTKTLQPRAAVPVTTQD